MARRDRHAHINNTEGYLTGNRLHTCLSSQINSAEEWFALVGRENVRQEVQAYGEAPFLGQLEASIFLEEVRAGVYGGFLLIFNAPFQHGYVIELEFGEGSYTHQTINRIFNLDRSIVEFATEYQLLAFLADPAEVDILMYRFMEGFNSFQHVLDEYSSPHICANQNGDEAAEGEAAAEAAVAIPPPPPVNDFGAIFREHYLQIQIEDPLENDEMPENENEIHWIENNHYMDNLIPLNILNENQQRIR